MGSPLESEIERDSRPTVQKRKPKLRWGEGGTSRIQISRLGAGPQSLQCLSTIPSSLSLSATLCSVPEAPPLLICPGTVQGDERWRAGPGEQNSTAGTGHESRWTRDRPRRTRGRRVDLPVQEMEMEGPRPGGERDEEVQE